MTHLPDGGFAWRQLARKVCPDCMSHGFILGPRGGAAQNIYCMNPDCRSAFNVTWHAGQLIFAQRIERPDDKLYEKWRDECGRDEFSVAQFYKDGTYSYLLRWVNAGTAVMAARSFIDHARPDTVERIIITDGGDHTCFEWKPGAGVTYPLNDGSKFVADE